MNSSKQKIMIAALVLPVLMFAAVEATAQRSAPKFPEFHYFTVSVGGGYSAFVSDFENTKLQGGGAATVGIGYEYCHRAFWLGLGLEAEWDNSTNKNQIYDFTEEMKDTEGDDMTYCYKMMRWHDSYSTVYVNIPFMLGFGIGGFYMGAGVKAGLNVYGHAQSTMKYRTSGFYDRYVEDFENMPDHFFDDYKSKNRYRVKYLPEISLIGEIGYEVASFGADKDSDAPIRLKLGAYVEYGFSKAYKNTAVADLVSIDDVNPAVLNLKPYILGRDITGNSFNNLFVGVKATFLFELPVPQKCNCLQTERGASWRNNAPRVTKMQRKAVKESQSVQTETPKK